MRGQPEDIFAKLMQGTTINMAGRTPEQKTMAKKLAFAAFSIKMKYDMKLRSDFVSFCNGDPTELQEAEIRNCFRQAANAIF